MRQQSNYNETKQYFQNNIRISATKNLEVFVYILEVTLKHIVIIIKITLEQINPPEIIKDLRGFGIRTGL